MLFTNGRKNEDFLSFITSIRQNAINNLEYDVKKCAWMVM